MPYHKLVSKRLKSPIKSKTFSNGILDRLLELYEKKLHLLVWQTTLFTGGFILTFHFLFINFLPDLDISSLLGLLTVVALTGLTISGLLALAFILPLISWFIILDSDNGKRLVNELRENKNKRNAAKEVESKENSIGVKTPTILSTEATCITTNKNQLKTDKSTKIEENQPQNAAYNIPQNLPLYTNSQNMGEISFSPNKKNYWEIILLSSLPPVITALVILLFNFLLNSWLSILATFPGIIFLLYISGLLAYFIVRSCSKQLPILKYKEIFVCTLIMMVSTIMFAGSYLFISAIFSSPYTIQNETPFKTFPQEWVIIIISLLVLFINSIQVEKFAKDSNKGFGQKIVEQIGFGIVILLVLTITSGSIFTIPEAVMRMYDLGNIQNVELILKDDGCKTVKQLNINYISEDETGFCRIPHSKILSRIGTNYFIESDASKRFSLSKDVVQSYGREAITRLDSKEPVKFSKLIEINLNEFQDFQYIYSNCEIKIESSVVNQSNEIYVITDYYNKQGKLFDRKLYDKNSLLSLARSANSEGQTQITFNSKPEKELVNGWCNIILLIDGKERSFKLNRTVITR